MEIVDHRCDIVLKCELVRIGYAHAAMRYAEPAARGRIAAMNPNPITLGWDKRIVIAFQHNILVWSI